MFTKCIFLSGVAFIVIINVVDYLQYGSDFLQFNIRFECRIIVFLPSKTENECARSSMDRIKDSGSFDWGSTPHGCTNVV